MEWLVSGEIDSADVFEEAKYRAFSNVAQRIQEAELMYELYTFRHRRATYPGGFEEASPANVSRIVLSFQ